MDEEFSTSCGALVLSVVVYELCAIAPRQAYYSAHNVYYVKSDIDKRWIA